MCRFLGILFFKSMVIPQTSKAIGTGIIVRKLTGKKFEEEQKTPGGILLPDEHEFDDQHFSVGEVLSVGAKVVEVKAGDYVLYRTHLALPLPAGRLEKPVLFKLDEGATITALIPK